MSKRTLKLSLNLTLDWRLSEAARESGLPLEGYVASVLASRLQICPVCGHEGPDVQLISFDGVDGTCACPPTPEEDSYLRALAAQGR